MWKSHHIDMELLQIVRSYRFELLFMIEVTSCNFLLFTSKKHITSRGKSMIQPPILGPNIGQPTLDTVSRPASICPLQDSSPYFRYHLAAIPEIRRGMAISLVSTTEMVAQAMTKGGESHRKLGIFLKKQKITIRTQVRSGASPKMNPS